MTVIKMETNICKSFDTFLIIRKDRSILFDRKQPICLFL
jgi:hypothetical protein